MKTSRGVVLALVVLAAVGGSASFYYYQGGSQVTSSQAGNREAVVKGASFTGFEVAAATASWADSLRDSSGEIYNTYYCDSDGTRCTGRDGVSLENNVMLYLLYSRMAKSDAGYSDKAEGELQLIQQACKESDRMECKAHYILALSESGAQAGAISEAGDRFIDSNYTEDILDTVRILTAIYKSDPDPATLKLAKYFLDEFKKAVTGRQIFDCAVKNSEMDVYLASGDSGLLEGAKSFFNQDNITEIIGEPQSPLQIIECAEAAGKLADSTGENKYRLISLVMTKSLVESFWDADGRGLSHSNGGFAADRLLNGFQDADVTLRAGILAAGFPHETLLEVA